ncbi:hypothetical protein CPC08DRAFT_343036 [Agrocybe pediades]|nr:hypothetical protein CPC08DRAFT_343036 [Agrocybe pediades]
MGQETGERRHLTKRVKKQRERYERTKQSDHRKLMHNLIKRTQTEDEETRKKIRERGSKRNTQDKTKGDEIETQRRQDKITRKKKKQKEVKNTRHKREQEISLASIKTN